MARKFIATRDVYVDERGLCKRLYSLGDEVPRKDAERFGFAETEVDESPPAGSDSEGDSGGSEQGEARLEDMTNAQLMVAAKELGCEVSTRATKDELIGAIRARQGAGSE